MARKASSGAGRAGRGKVKRQRSFELVSPSARVVGSGAVTNGSVATTIQEVPTSFSAQGSPVEQRSTVKDERLAGKRSAAAILATRRRTLRSGPSAVMSAEDYAYVRRDLVRIAVLSVLMVAGIVVLYLLLGR